MGGLVCDRDTFKVKCNDREPKIRLCEIDGPEAKQPLEIESRNYLRFLIQYFGQFLIANPRIRVSRLQGKFATNGKSLVSEYELKTVRTLVKTPENCTAERALKGKGRLEFTSPSFDPKIFKRSRGQTFTTSASRFLWRGAD